MNVREYIEKLAATAESTHVVTLSTTTTTTGGGEGGTTSTGSQQQQQQQLVPYINTFEGALGENQRLLATLTGRMGLLEDSLGEGGSAAGDLYARVATMGTTLNQLLARFSRLSAAYESCQLIASRSGRLIEALHKQRRKSADVRELFTIFSDIIAGRGTGRLDAILESASTDVRLHGAQLMRRLQLLGRAGICAEEEGNESTSATQVIDELARTYEERLLGEFHSAFEENNMAAMRTAASLLVKYNGGESCMRSFISQHAFFLEPVRPETLISTFHPSRASQGSTSAHVPLNLGIALAPDPLLTGLYEQIAQTVEADWNYLEAVFEDPVRVMSYLLARIFKEPVRLHLEEIFKQARGHSSLAYLRALFSSYQATRELVFRLQTSYERHVRELGARDNQLSSVIDDKLSAAEGQLDGLLDELFSPHLRNVSAYVSMEMNVFAELLQAATAPMQTYASQVRRSSKGLISLGAAVFGRATGGGGNAISAVASPIGAEGGSSVGGGIGGGGDLYMFADGKGLVSTPSDPSLPQEEVISRCLTLHAELAARLYVLLPPGDARAQALLQAIRTLFVHLFDRYLEVALDCAVEVSEVSSKGFDAHSFAVVQAACRALGLVLSYTHQTILPLMVAASGVCYREMVQAKTEAAARITERIDRLLRRECEGALTFIEESLLSRQRKSDFKPKPDDLEALMGPTPVSLFSSPLFLSFFLTLSLSLTHTLSSPPLPLSSINKGDGKREKGREREREMEMEMGRERKRKRERGKTFIVLIH